MIFDHKPRFMLFRVTTAPRKPVGFLGGVIFGARSSNFHGENSDFNIPTGLAT